ncbi:MAG: hypothetical protein Pars2KO_32980 [Parasphingorhabdus sp.]
MEGNTRSEKDTRKILIIMFDDYFDGWDVKPSFDKEYISLWSGWLGKSDYHLLDQVTEEEWSRFNRLISLLSEKCTLGLVDRHKRSIAFPTNIEETFSSYEDSMNKDSAAFSAYIIEELECVITEEWDFTYIVWHKGNGAIDLLSSDILRANLKQFS